MKIATLAFAASALIAGTAFAAGGTATFSATITEAFEDAPAFGHIPAGYDDPRFSVGDVLSFTATLSDIFILPGTPYYGARASIDTLGGISDLNDGFAYFKQSLSTGWSSEIVTYPSPIVIFTADRVVGVAGVFLTSDGDRPGYSFPSWLTGYVACSRPDPTTVYTCAKDGAGSDFDLFLGSTGGVIGGYYANAYPNSYILEFDWAASSVDADLANLGLVAAPEPATWAMMILGFGMAGSALRRRVLAG